MTPWSSPITHFVFGAIIGSFLNVVIHRLPEGESIVSPPSRCPACKKRIRAADNIPIVSYILLRGRCRYCGEGISMRYPLVEAANGILYVYLAHHFGIGFPFAVWAVFCSALVAVIFIDLDHMIIPDAITLPGMAAGLLVSFWMPKKNLLVELLFSKAGIEPGFWASVSFADSLLALLAGGGFFYVVAVASDLILKRPGMGGGDIKLTAMMGSFLGLTTLGVGVFLGLLFGSVIGIALILTKIKSRKDYIPFGPFLAVGGMCALFWGTDIMVWYLNLTRF